jgi:hypothetical protein
MNPCIICPNGVGTGMGDVEPNGENTGTCAELIDAAKLYETGSLDCASAEVHQLSCCYTEPKNPCIICPNGATAGVDFVPQFAYALTCGELIEGALLLETECDICELFGDLYKPYCCPPATPTPTPTPTTTPTESPTQTSTDMNPCIICPNGVDTGMGDAPYGENTGTCAELIDAAKLFKTGSWGCAWAESSAISCCPAAPENPCIICPNGVHTGMGDVEPIVEISGTCADNIDYAKRFETGSDYCGLVGELYESYCCPPENTTAMNPCIICVGTGMGDVPVGENNLTCAELMDAAKQYETGSQDCAWAESNAFDCCITEPENPCIICPNGVHTGMSDVKPIVEIIGTCTANIDYAKYFETDSDYCGVAEMYEAYCCPPETPAPTPMPTTSVPTETPTTTTPTESPTQSSTGAPITSTPSTMPVDDTTVPTTTTSSIIVAPIPVEPLTTSPSSNGGKLTTSSSSNVGTTTLFWVLVIPAVAGAYLMALAVYILRKRVAQVQGPATTSPSGVDQMPEGGIPTAVASKIDPETVDTSFLQLYPVPPPAYAPYASAPPQE